MYCKHLKKTENEICYELIDEIYCSSKKHIIRELLPVVLLIFFSIVIWVIALAFLENNTKFPKLFELIISNDRIENVYYLYQNITKVTIKDIPVETLFKGGYFLFITFFQLLFFPRDKKMSLFKKLFNKNLPIIDKLGAALNLTTVIIYIFNIIVLMISLINKIWSPVFLTILSYILLFFAKNKAINIFSHDE